MNIMETYALPEKAFYEWHVGNGCGYEVELEPEQWQKTAKKFQRVRKIESIIGIKTEDMIRTTATEQWIPSLFVYMCKYRNIQKDFDIKKYFAYYS